MTRPVPPVRYCLGIACLLLSAAAQATVLTAPDGRVSVTFDPGSFELRTFVATGGGIVDERPVPFSVVAIDGGVRLDAPLVASASFDFFTGSSVRAPFSFAAASGQAIGGYDITVQGRYGIDGRGSVGVTGQPVTLVFSDEAGSGASTSFSQRLAGTSPQLDLQVSASTAFQTGLPPFYSAQLSIDSISVQAHLAPVPEPDAAWLMAAGLLALGAVAKRRPQPREAAAAH